MAVPAEDQQEEADAARRATGDDKGLVATSAVEHMIIRIGTVCEKSKTNCLMIVPAKRAPHALPTIVGRRRRDATVLEARSEITKYSATVEIICVGALSAGRSWSQTPTTSHQLGPHSEGLVEDMKIPHPYSIESARGKSALEPRALL